MKIVRNLTQFWRVALLAAALASMALQPVRAQELSLPVPRVTLYPGDVIADDQVIERAFIAHTVTRSSVLDSREAAVGKVARRTLLEGKPIPVNSIRDPYLVIKNKNALVVFEEGGLTITTNAMALENGGAGDFVKLRNIDSGTEIRGTVAPDGTVRLAGP